MKTYVLLKLVTAVETDSNIHGPFSWWRSYPMPLDDADDNSKKRSYLQFVTQVQTPQDVATEVRKAPLEQYFVLEGELHKVSVAISVFINGKAAN